MDHVTSELDFRLLMVLYDNVYSGRRSRRVFVYYSIYGSKLNTKCVCIKNGFAQKQDICLKSNIINPKLSLEIIFLCLN